MFCLEERIKIPQLPPSKSNTSQIVRILARPQGYAARIRVGFGAYFVDGCMLDHTVAEIWDPAAERWRLVDADVPADWGREVQGVKVNVLDLRSGVDFQTAPQAWQQVRAGAVEDDRSRYTGSVGAPPELCGEVLIAHNVVHDLAALAKTELLLWEEWGARVDYTDTLPAADIDVLDEVAAVTARQDVTSEAVEMLMRREDMAVPETVMLFDPYAATAPPKPVDVSRALKAQV